MFFGSSRQSIGGGEEAEGPVRQPAMLSWRKGNSPESAQKERFLRRVEG